MLIPQISLKSIHNFLSICSEEDKQADKHGSKHYLHQSVAEVII